MSFFSRTKDHDSVLPVAVVEENATIEKVLADLGPLVSQIAHGANRIQEKIAAKRSESHSAAVELAEIGKSAVHAERLGVDVQEKVRAQQETVGRLQSDLKELENELKDLRGRGPKEFASAKGRLARAQEQQKQIILSALQAAAGAARRAEELGRAYEDRARDYQPVARNFRLHPLDSTLPPRPPHPGDTITGHSRYALKMREYDGKNQSVSESPHRRWPTNDAEFFDRLLKAWEK